MTTSTTKEKLNELNTLGFSNGFISRVTSISAARIFNAGGNRSVSLSTDEHDKITTFYHLALKLVRVGAAGSELERLRRLKAAEEGEGA